MQISRLHLDQLDRARWHELVEDCPHSTPFCRLEWLELLEVGVPRWHVHCIVAEENGRYLGAIPLIVTVGTGVRQSHSLAHGCPAGPILAQDEDPELASDLLGWWADRHSSAWYGFRLSVTLDRDDPLELTSLHSRDFRIERQTTFRIPLDGRTYDEWESSLSQQARNKNRQAEERGGTYERVIDPGLAPEIARLAGLTATRHCRDSVPYEQRFYSALLHPDGPMSGAPDLARVVMVKVDGRPAAFNLCLVHKGRMWLIDHGADSSMFDARPNNLIYSSIVRDAIGEGLREIDLGAVPPGADSLARFKAGLGGEPATRLSAVRSNLLFRMMHKAAAVMNWCGE